MSRFLKILAGVVVIALAAFAVARLVNPWQREPVDWSLVGTEDNGRALVLGFVDTYGPCIRNVHSRVASSPRADSVDLVVTAEVKHCEQQSAARLAPRTVRLGTPIAGKPVRGEARSLRPFRPNPLRGLPSTPDVRGLNVLDATAVASTLGYKLHLGVPNEDPATRGVRRQRIQGHVVTVWF